MTWAERGRCENGGPAGETSGRVVYRKWEAEDRKQEADCVNASSGTIFLWTEDGTVMLYKTLQMPVPTWKTQLRTVETGVQTSCQRDKPEHHTGQLGFGVHSLGIEMTKGRH